MIIQPQQKMDLLKCQISVAATYMGAEPPIIAIQDIFFGAIQQGNSTSSRMLLIGLMWKIVIESSLKSRKVTNMTLLEI